MKAIVQNKYGSPEVLRLREVPDPVPGANDVLIQVHAAGCGPDVWHLMTGLPYMARPAIGWGKPKVGVPGWDISGRVEAVGRTVRAFALGDEVMGTVKGSFAELAIGSPAKLVPRPARLSFAEAAAVPISGVTALQALRDAAGLRAGQSVAVIGAAGGVGTFTVQIAKASGARVTGICSTSKADLVLSIGADDVIDYTSEDFTDGRRRWDVIIDTAGRRPLHRLRRALNPHGTLVVVGGDGGGRWTGGFFRGVLRGPLLSPFIGQRLRGLNARQRRADLGALAGLIDAGKVTPVIDQTYPLEAARDAVWYLEQGHPRGKVVITVREEDSQPR
jgi:NADPH:quinone reductase-like Zn-dependent oxidoreductase